jgi:hypothetical protein
MLRAHCSILIVVALLSGAAVASADPAKETRAAATKPQPERPRRRAQKLDHSRSVQERRARVHVIDTVTVVGRSQRPMSVFEVNVKAFRFPVGTARYSPRDRRFVRRGR